MKRITLFLLILLILLAVSVPVTADDPCQDNPQCDDPRAPGQPLCLGVVLPILIGVVVSKRQTVS
jgi:hypothetical protein